MMPRKRHLLALCGAAVATITATTAARAQDAAAPNAGMRFFSAAAQADARDNREAQLTLSLPLARRGWLQLGGGQARSEGGSVSHRPALASAGLGYLGAGWQASLGATHRDDSPAYRQSDATGTLEWQGDRFSLGLDGAWRQARQQVSVSAPDGQGGTAVVPVLQTVKGGGLGAHAGVRLGSASLRAAFMRYDLRVRTQQSGSSGAAGNVISGLLGNRTLLSQALSTRASAVNRDEAALSRSVQLAARWQFETVALSAEYTGDKVLDAPGTVHTLRLAVPWELSPRWTLVPAVGRTRSDTFGDVNFGALSASFAW